MCSSSGWRETVVVSVAEAEPPLRKRLLKLAEQAGKRGNPSRPKPGQATTSTSGRIVGGVAGLLAARLGASPLVVRVAFAILGLAGGVGVVLYLGLWLVGPDPSRTPRPRTLRHDLGVVAATASILATTFILMPTVPAALIGPMGFVAFALAFSAGPEIGADLISGRAFGRIVVGLVLMFGGLFAGVAALGDIGQIWVISAAIAAVTVGGGVVLAPWLRQLIDGASLDRVERIRAEERSDIAAHLHDSVLQTLTLIQNRSDESHVVSSIAYQQERELRRWLYEQSGSEDGTQSEDSGSLRTELTRVASAVEDDYLVVVDLVFVGEAQLSLVALNALIGAVREALINAAKFAETDTISLYAEIDDERALAFVRDRGVGFDPDAVPDDRRGIADSIVDRIERVGGTTRIRSTPATGTEVRMEVPL